MPKTAYNWHAVLMTAYRLHVCSSIGCGGWGGWPPRFLGQPLGLGLRGQFDNYLELDLNLSLTEGGGYILNYIYTVSLKKLDLCAWDHFRRSNVLWDTML